MALGVKELLRLATGPFLQATGKMGLRLFLVYVKEITLTHSPNDHIEEKPTWSEAHGVSS